MEWAEGEYGIGHGTWADFDNGTVRFEDREFDSVDAAGDWLYDATDKHGPAIAVRAVKAGNTDTRALAQALCTERLGLRQATLGIFKATARAPLDAGMRTCRCCGSTINLARAWKGKKDGVCPVCQDDTFGYDFTNEALAVIAAADARIAGIRVQLQAIENGELVETEAAWVVGACVPD